jgi:uncharacterized DUF497 family protein
MSEIHFVWDKQKAAINKKRHGVSFEEAQSVFYDDNALEFFDPDHSKNENRFIMLGMSFRARILVVCHCVRGEGSIIRIISARKATKRESKNYQEGKI